MTGLKKKLVKMDFDFFVAVMIDLEILFEITQC